MLMLFFVKENLFFIRGDLPNIYKEDLQARTTKDTWTRASSAIESGQAHQILLTNQLTNSSIYCYYPTKSVCRIIEINIQLIKTQQNDVA
jgi:hypothetical protein